MGRVKVPSVGKRDLSLAADARLTGPKRRGSFRPVDAARRQLALLTVADDLGQARIYWLVDLESKVIEDARFLAFGSLASHPATDWFCEQVMGKTLSEACDVGPESIESGLRDSPDAPAFGDAPSTELLAYIPQLLGKAMAEEPNLKVLPKPVEKEVYVRKREQDWDEQDQAWLPLSLLRKIGKVQKIAKTVLGKRLGRDDVNFELEGLHDDFKVVISYENLPSEEVAVVNGLISDALRNDVHPLLQVVEA